MNEARLLVVKNGPKRPSNGDRRRKVAFGRSEGVSGSGAFKEEAENDRVSWYLQCGQWKTVQGKENKNVGPDTGTLEESVYTKCFERADDN